MKHLTAARRASGIRCFYWARVYLTNKSLYELTGALCRIQAKLDERHYAYDPTKDQWYCPTVESDHVVTHSEICARTLLSDEDLEFFALFMRYKLVHDEC